MFCASWPVAFYVYSNHPSIPFSATVAATHSNQTIEQRVRSLCFHVGVDSLKENQIEALKAIISNQDKFICLPRQAMAAPITLQQTSLM